jgi:beta-lactamase class A
MRRTFLFTITLAVLLGAFPAIAQTPAPTNPAGTQPVAAPPSTPAGKALTQVLKLFTDDPDAITEADLADSFKAQVPLAKLKLVVAQIHASEGDLILDSIEPGATDRSLVADVLGKKKQTPFKLRLALDESDKIIGLLIQPGVDRRVPEFKTWADLERAIEGVAEKAAYIIRAERHITTGEGGIPTFSTPQTRWDLVVYHDADEPLAIGSAFKLWVLSAIADGSNRARWDEKIKIRDDLKSLPSGVMQNQPDGAEFTVREFAEKMISISDNSAADHLIHYIGRDKCEAAMARVCEQNADLNRPFLTTRDLFVLKLSGSDDLPRRYIAADTDARRAMLPEFAKETPKAALALAWKAPRFIDSLEWFASPREMANTLQWLDLLSQREQWDVSTPQSAAAAEATGEKSAIRRILSINPGIPFDRKVWPFVAYKGGSEPGVMSLNWLLERADHRRFVFSITFNDTKKAIDEPKAIAIAQRAIEFLGKGMKPAKAEEKK